MSTRDDRAQAATPNAEPWTIPGVARELVVILSASAGIVCASVAAPTVPRNCRRDAKGFACRARSIISFTRLVTTIFYAAVV